MGMNELPEEGGRGKQRLVRLLIIAGVAFGVVVGMKSLAQPGKARSMLVAGVVDPMKSKLDSLGEKVLGETVKHLPGAPDLEEVKIEDTESGIISGEAETTEGETEPIREPTENVQKQTEILIEMLKKLPEDQLKAIKKQIYKDFCEKLLE